MKLAEYKELSPRIFAQVGASDALHRGGGVGGLPSVFGTAGLAEVSAAKMSGGTGGSGGQGSAVKPVKLPSTSSANTNESLATTASKKIKYPTSVKSIPTSGYSLSTGNTKPLKFASIDKWATKEESILGMMLKMSNFGPNCYSNAISGNRTSVPTAGLPSMSAQMTPMRPSMQQPAQRAAGMPGKMAL